MAKNLRDGPNIRVVSNNIGVIAELLSAENCRLMVPGGELERAGASACLSGRHALRNISKLYFQKCFISVAAADLNAGYMVDTEDEAELYQILMQHSEQTTLLLDYSKFGRARWSRCVRSMRSDCDLQHSDAGGLQELLFRPLALRYLPRSRICRLKRRVLLMSNNLIELQNVCAILGRTQVLDHVNLQLREGEILGLWGDNGSGKSVLVSLLAGVHAPSQGQILLDGKAYCPSSPSDAQHRGVQTIFQQPALAAESLGGGKSVHRRGRSGTARFLGMSTGNGHYAQAEESFCELGCRHRRACGSAGAESGCSSGSWSW